MKAVLSGMVEPPKPRLTREREGKSRESFQRRMVEEPAKTTAFFGGAWVASAAASRLSSEAQRFSGGSAAKARARAAREAARDAVRKERRQRMEESEK
jgi:hypothetical protein